MRKSHLHKMLILYMKKLAINTDNAWNFRRYHKIVINFLLKLRTRVINEPHYNTNPKCNLMVTKLYILFHAAHKLKHSTQTIFFRKLRNFQLIDFENTIPNLQINL